MAVLAENAASVSGDATGPAPRGRAVQLDEAAATGAFVTAAARAAKERRSAEYIVDLGDGGFDAMLFCCWCLVYMYFFYEDAWLVLYGRE